MAKKKRALDDKPKAQISDKPATLKDLLGADTVAKLKAKSEELQAEEAQRQEQLRQREEDDRLAERKRLENDFEHLLKNSSQDWTKYK